MSYPQNPDTIIVKNIFYPDGLKEIDNFLQQQNIKYDNSYYLPCSNIEILERMISNLMASYEKTNELKKIDDLKELSSILQSEIN